MPRTTPAESRNRLLNGDRIIALIGRQHTKTDEAIGRAAIKKLAKENPAAFARLMARIVMRLRKSGD